MLVPPMSVLPEKWLVVRASMADFTAAMLAALLTSIQLCTVLALV